MAVNNMKRKSFGTLFVSVLVFSCTVKCDECSSSDTSCNATKYTDDNIKTSVTEHMSTHIPKPAESLKSMNMLAEDTDNLFRPTVLSFTTSKPEQESRLTNKIAVSEEPKGRALNFTVDQHTNGNVLSNSSKLVNDFDLSDVSIDNEDEEEIVPRILAPKSATNTTLGVCEKNGLTYENGQTLEIGCDSICTCKNGTMDCVERCKSPFFRSGKKIDDPLCSPKLADDHCCSIMVCAGDTETEPLEICTYNNKTYNRGDTFEKECVESCTCELAGKVNCKPRCPQIKQTSDTRCVEVPDPDDFCCMKILCDVTIDENEPDKEDDKTRPQILSAKFVNTTTVLIKFDTKINDNETVDISDDKSTWLSYKVTPEGYVFTKGGGKYLKLENSNEIVDIQNAEAGQTLNNNGCQYKGRSFSLGEEYNDECSALCICGAKGMNCMKLQCPTYFGVDVLDPNCVEWETIPPDFKPTPPSCCPESVRCKNNGSCEFDGHTFKNWEQLPINVTGCEKRCYCEMGKVECQNVCPPVTALPPPSLECPPNFATVSHIPEDDCCKYWVCNPPQQPTKAHNETNSDKGQSTDIPTQTYKDPFSSKKPSKILGPLAVYANDNSKQSDPLNNIQKPKVAPEENPFYHMSQNQPKPNIIHDSKQNQSKLPNVDERDKNNYLGPLNPSFSGKMQKGSKKENALFVTPPPREIHMNNIAQQFDPNFKPEKTEIEIHSQNNPDELLQFIHQHPEFSNIPHGSVLEIHSLPLPVTQKPELSSFFNQATPGNSQIHLVPYVVPEKDAGVPGNALPSGFTLEQILNEFHKNTQSQNNIQVPFLPRPQIPFSNRPGIFPQQNGPLLPNRLNATYSDFGGQMFPGFQKPTDDILVHTLEAIDPHTVQLAFMVPRIIVGLHGRVEVRYTHKDDDNDIDSWMLQVFAPPNDLIATPSLEFDLVDLKADTEYRIKITITLRDSQTNSSSRIYRIKTPKEVQVTTLPLSIPIEPDLAITDINATWVTVSWRKFTEYELQFIDGVQLRFKEIDGKIYAATPLIHRAVTSYILENLKPNTKYEIGIDLIPFPEQQTELQAKNMLHFTTANEINNYGFNVSLEVSKVKSQSVEIAWNGVPYPEDKYVNIYRTIYQSDSGKEDQSTFKLAKRDSPTKTVIMDLKPGTRYRIWLEVYLTNGKIKTSNVQDFITKPRLAPPIGTTQQDKLSRAELMDEKGDYYGPLVIVGILAAIAILSTLVLLLILVRRHNQNKAAITPPMSRVNQSAYDNPTYKVEIQQETMGL